ncbi:MAG: Na/Pi cotransporter family protein [Clostridiales bacterium]|nr:Na/Pi cotransporter family protein [Clostridiales bacterium]
MSVVWNIFFMFGGVAAMMFGMKIMGAALEQVASGGMKKLLGKVTSNRFAGVGVGIAVTSIIQSSTATTVMLVGFVNIGLMTLVQATNVIMGANIGTTITAHIVSLSGVGAIDVGAIAAMVGCVGVLMAMLVKNEKVINIGNILGGLGLLFVGLEFISTYAKEIMFVGGDKSQPIELVQLVFQGDHNPLLLILIGIVLTALVHSSSTITSLMVVLASIGVLPFDNALFLALGSNIGTCITSILSSAGTHVNAKRTAIVHLLFNTFGCLIFIAPLWIWRVQVTSFFASISNDVGQQIAIFHTMFNIVTTLILLPLAGYVVKLACVIIPDKKTVEDEDKFKFHYIDSRMLETPAIATSNLKKEIIRMSKFSIDNMNYSVEMLLSGSEEKVEIMKENEDILNHLNKNITAFLTKLMSKDLSEQDDKKIGSYYHVVSDLERVGDYAENIMEYAMRLKEEDVKMSEDARGELNQVREMINNLYEKVIKAFDDRDLSILDEIEEIEESIDDISVELEHRHIERVKAGSCNAQLGSVFLQTVSNLERVGDHITNVANSLKGYSKAPKNA